MCKQDSTTININATSCICLVSFFIFKCTKKCGSTKSDLLDDG